MLHNSDRCYGVSALLSHRLRCLVPRKHLDAALCARSCARSARTCPRQACSLAGNDNPTHTGHVARARRPSNRFGDEIMLVGLLDGSLHALDPSNGQQLWEYSTGAPLVTSHTQDSLVSATSDAPDFFPGVDGRLYHISEDDRSLEVRPHPSHPRFPHHAPSTAHVHRTHDSRGVLLAGAK